MEFSFQGFLVHQDNPWTQQFDIFNNITLWLLLQQHLELIHFFGYLRLAFQENVFALCVASQKSAFIFIDNKI